LVAYLAIAVNSNLQHFFLAPVVFEIIIAACFGAAIVTAKGKSA
jgi:uncharacterized membrane protein